MIQEDKHELGWTHFRYFSKAISTVALQLVVWLRVACCCFRVTCCLKFIGLIILEFHQTSKFALSGNYILIEVNWLTTIYLYGTWNKILTRQ